MKKHNWKLIKKLVSNYGQSNSEKGEPRCTPIFVHKSTFPVPVNEKFVSVFNGLYASDWKQLKGKPLESPRGRYNYLISVIKKYINNFNYYWVKIVINDEYEENEPIVDEQLFSAESTLESLEIRNYVTVPNRIFKVEKKHKDILLFDGSEMTEKNFLEVVDKWMDQKPKL